MAFFKFKTLLKKDKKVSPKIEVENPGLVADTKIARSTKLRNSIRQVTNKLRLTKAIPPGPIGIWYQDRGHNHALEFSVTSSFSSSFIPSTEIDCDNNVERARSTNSMRRLNHGPCAERFGEAFTPTSGSDYDRMGHAHNVHDSIPDFQHRPGAGARNHITSDGLYGDPQDLAIHTEGVYNLAGYQLDEVISTPVRVGVVDNVGSGSPDYSPWPIRHVRRRPPVMFRRTSLASQSSTSTRSAVELLEATAHPSKARFCTALITMNHAVISRPFACLLHAAVTAASVLLSDVPGRPISVYQAALEEIEVATWHARNMSAENTSPTSSVSIAKAQLSGRKREWHDILSTQDPNLQNWGDKIRQLRQTSIQGLALLEQTLQQEIESKQFLEKSQCRVQDLEQRLESARHEENDSQQQPLEISRVEKDRLQERLDDIRIENTRPQATRGTNTQENCELRRLLASSGTQVAQGQFYVAALQQEVAHQTALSYNRQQQVNRLDTTNINLRRQIHEAKKEVEDAKFHAFAEQKLREEKQKALDDSIGRHGIAVQMLSENRDELFATQRSSVQAVQRAQDAELDAKDEAGQKHCHWEEAKYDNQVLSQQNRDLVSQFAEKHITDPLLSQFAVTLQASINENEALRTLLQEQMIQKYTAEEAHKLDTRCIAKQFVQYQAREDELEEAQRKIEELDTRLVFSEQGRDEDRHEIATANAQAEAANAKAATLKQQCDIWRDLVAEKLQQQLPEAERTGFQQALLETLQTDLRDARKERDEVRKTLQRYKVHAAERIREYQLTATRIEYDWESYKAWSGDLVTNSQERYHQLKVAEAKLEAVEKLFGEQLKAEPLTVREVSVEKTDEELGPEQIFRRDQLFEWYLQMDWVRMDQEYQGFYEAHPERIKAMYGFGSKAWGDAKKEKEDMKQKRVTPETAKWDLEIENIISLLRQEAKGELTPEPQEFVQGHGEGATTEITGEEEEAPDAADVEQELAAQTLSQKWLDGDSTDLAMESKIPVGETKEAFQNEVEQAFATRVDTQKKLRRERRKLAIHDGSSAERPVNSELNGYQDCQEDWMQHQ